MYVKEPFIWAFWDQNVGPGWVKNDEKIVFKPATLLPTQFPL